MTASPLWAWPLGGPLYTSRYPVSPSHYGFNLDETNPGYYGGGRYREYYSYGRGYGLSSYPGPLPAYPPAPPRVVRLIPSTPAEPSSRDLPHDGTVAQPIVQVPTNSRSGAPSRTFDSTTAQLIVQVPAEAEVWLEGAKTRQPGALRHFVTPPLTPSDDYSYEIRARWRDEGREVEQTQKVVIRAGERVRVRFPLPPEREDALPEPRRFVDPI